MIGNVVTRGNPLMEAILDLGVRLYFRPSVAGGKRFAGNGLAVAGTMERRPPSSMLAWILECAGLPGIPDRGHSDEFRLSARTRRFSFFVIEADEYDTAFFDKRSKFVHFRSRTAVLNNLEFDHADIFDASQRLSGNFTIWCAPSGNGLIIANGREKTFERVDSGMLDAGGTDRGGEMAGEETFA